MCSLDDLQKSDTILCNNHAYLIYKDRQFNDRQFLTQITQTKPECIRDIEKESKMFIVENSKKAECSDMLNTRGGNANNCELPKNCPNYDSSYYLNNFLLVPCKKPTYKNYLVYDDKKQCSARHQILNNVTKRKEISGMEM